LGHDEVCGLLLVCFKTGDRLSIDMRSGERNQTALMLAASCGNEKTVGLLLKNGASVDAIDNQNYSALHYATECHQDQIVRHLLLAGANPNLPPPSPSNDHQSTNRYLTPFQLACANGLDVIVQYFLHCGAATENNSAAESGRLLALRHGHTKVVTLIENYRHFNGGAKFDDKLQPIKPRSHLDGPNAISSLMKLQCSLTDSYSDLYECRNPISISNERMNDYEKTLISEQQQHKRPKTMEELLEVLDLSKYLNTFQEKKVDLEKLLTLNADGLKEVGITLFGPRKKILNAIERWHQNVPLTQQYGN